MGSALANLLSKAGCEVTQEYYVNDQGLQIETLGLSLLLNYLSLGGEKIKLPKECYQGDYLKTLASDLKKNKQKNTNSLFQKNYQQILMTGSFWQKKSYLILKS